VRLHLSREQYQQLAVPTEGEDGKWDGLLSFMHDGLFVELGVHFPTMSVHIDDALRAPWFRCEWNDLRLPPRLGIGVDELWSTTRWTGFGVSGSRGVRESGDASAKCDCSKEPRGPRSRG
jgi:hypothetical protein